MKAFLIGFIFVILVGILSGIGCLLMPFAFMLMLFLRVILVIAFVIFGIWLLGKLIIYAWERIK